MLKGVGGLNTFSYLQLTSESNKSNGVMTTTKQSNDNNSMRIGNKKALKEALIQINDYLHSVGGHVILPMHDSEAIETYAFTSAKGL